eukprot:jgi/Chrzof1/9902/Cz04g20070.t1
MSGDTFGDTRVKKHGPLWKTNILGAPTVMVYDEVDVKAVLAAEGKTAAVTWPDATAQLVGPASLNLLTPPRQTAVKAVFMKAFSDRTCQQYIARMVEATQAVLDVWVHAHHTAAQQAQDTGSSGAQAVELISSGMLHQGLALSNLIASATFHYCVLGIPAGTDMTVCTSETNMSVNTSETNMVSTQQQQQQQQQQQHQQQQQQQQLLITKEACENAELAAMLAAGFQTPPINLPFTSFGKAVQARSKLLTKYDKAIQDAQRRLVHDSSDGTSTHAVRGQTALKALLLSSAQSSEPLSYDELREGSISCLFGNASAGPTISKIFQYLADDANATAATSASSNTHMQRLHEEQQTLIANHGPDITPAMLSDMHYGEACAMEVLRLNPAVPAMFRIALEDFELAGRLIPKGWRVWCYTGDSVLSYNADEFNPERWLAQSSSGSSAVYDSNSEEAAAGGHAEMDKCPARTNTLPHSSSSDDGHDSAHQDAYGGNRTDSTGTVPVASTAVSSEFSLPFGAGPRGCVGRSFMLLQLKVLLAVLVRQYRWSVADTREPWVLFPAPKPKLYPHRWELQQQQQQQQPIRRMYVSWWHACYVW